MGTLADGCMPCPHWADIYIFFSFVYFWWKRETLAFANTLHWLQTVAESKYCVVSCGSAANLLWWIFCRIYPRFSSQHIRIFFAASSYTHGAGATSSVDGLQACACRTTASKKQQQQHFTDTRWSTARRAQARKYRGLGVITRRCLSAIPCCSVSRTGALYSSKHPAHDILYLFCCIACRHRHCTRFWLEKKSRKTAMHLVIRDVFKVTWLTAREAWTAADDRGEGGVESATAHRRPRVFHSMLRSTASRQRLGYVKLLVVSYSD